MANVTGAATRARRGWPRAKKHRYGHCDPKKAMVRAKTRAGGAYDVISIGPSTCADPIRAMAWSSTRSRATVVSRQASHVGRAFEASTASTATFLAVDAAAHAVTHPGYVAVPTTMRTRAMTPVTRPMTAAAAS